MYAEGKFGRNMSDKDLVVVVSATEEYGDCVEGAQDVLHQDQWD